MCMQYKSFENTVGKGEIARNEQFLPFPQCFLLTLRTFSHFHQVQNCHLQTLSICENLKLVIWERVKSFFTNFSFNRSVRYNFVEKKKKEPNKFQT